MSQTREFYLARAAEAANEAANAKLANVADRALRSQQAFEAMAQRIALADARRAKAEAEKAELHAAETGQD